MAKKTDSNGTILEQSKYDLNSINGRLPRGEGHFEIGKLKGKECLRYFKRCQGKKLVVSGYTERSCYIAMVKKEKEYLDSLEKAKRYEQGALDADFIEAFRKWLTDIKQKDRSLKKSTFDRAERTFDTRIVGDGKFAGMKVGDVDKKTIEGFLDYVMYEAPRTGSDKKGFSLSETKKVYDLLNQFFHYFYEKDPISNPMLSVPRPKQKQDDTGSIDTDNEEIDADLVLTDDEITRFEDECFRRDTTKWGLVLIFMLETFIRQGEMRALKWKNIDFKNRTVYIRETASVVKVRNPASSKKQEIDFTVPKTKCSIRSVRMSEIAMDAMSAWKERTTYSSDDDRVATTDGGKVITQPCLTRALNRVLRNAEIDKKITLHYLRHSGISYWLRKGMPIDVVSKMAGHASTKITEQRYYHIINQQLDEAADLMDMINAQRRKKSKQIKVPSLMARR